MQDRDLLKALEEAEYLWYAGVNMTPEARLETTIALSEWGLFTVAQLSLVSRIPRSTLYTVPRLRHSNGSGRFNPQSLDKMRQIVLDRINEVKINENSVLQSLAEGNSQRTVAKLTGLNRSTIARIARN